MEQSFNLEMSVFDHGTSLPSLSFRQRALLKMNSLPLVRRFSFVKRLLFESLKLPKSAKIGPGFSCSSGNLRLGNNVYLNDTFILDYANVFIGDNTSFSYKNIIVTSTHDFNDFHKVVCKPVSIGRNVWITTSVIILPGVTIGDNTVIGAGSIVTSNIPSGVFAAGNPCKVIKKIDFIR